MDSPFLDHRGLIFSSAATALKDALGDIQRSHLSVKNRLHSIIADATFVQTVADAYGLPLVANERCGSWYIPAAASPEDSTSDTFKHIKQGSAYFKSTDGHNGQWSFSLRRLNTQILTLLGENGGCIIVDSTRRGKSMPDALSKTVPIWVAVLNRLLFPDRPDFHNLHTPQDVISPSEHAQIESKIDGFVQQAKLLSLNVEELRGQLCHAPIACTWQRPGDLLPSDRHTGKPTSKLVVCCTASNHVSLATSASSTYVQGAADDHETWALGMDATMFWQNRDMLLRTPEDELPNTIASIMSKRDAEGVTSAPISISPTQTVWISNNASVEAHFADYHIVISCIDAPSLVVGKRLGKAYIPIICSTGKVGSRQLRTKLESICSVPALIAALPEDVSPKILISCHTGSDLAVGVALAVLCKYHTENGALTPAVMAPPANINKDLTRHRLSWIMTSMPHARPSRATLLSANAFLMSP